MAAGRRAVAVAAATTIGVAAIALCGASADASTTEASANVNDGVLEVVGTNGDDRITVDFAAGDSVTVHLGGTRDPRRFNRNAFESVSVVLGSGNDDFRTVSGGSTVDAPMTIRAGGGSDAVAAGAASDVISGNTGVDVLRGGGGTDLLLGGDGADDVNGGAGTDTEILGRGADVAGWDPGEGSDVVDGGAGVDVLVFNGSDAAEQFVVAPNGTSALLLRNLGAIRMDLDAVERLDLSTFGGVDDVTVGDLTGTDLSVSAIELSAVGGTAEGLVDRVTVNGTERADQVDVTAVGEVVALTGLRAEVVIAGGEPQDQLVVHTFDGDDSVEVSDAARALLDISFDLGVDQR